MKLVLMLFMAIAIVSVCCEEEKAEEKVVDEKRTESLLAVESPMEEDDEPKTHLSSLSSLSSLHHGSNTVACPVCTCNCPATTTCPSNEVYVQCKNACTELCPNEAAACSTIVGSCLAGCTCQSGYRRKNGQCILESSCYSTPPICGANEHYSTCPRLSDESCPGTIQFIQPEVCGTPRCVCNQGFVRSGSVCVSNSICNTQNCPVNQVYDSCKMGGLCGDYCGDRPSNCNNGAGTCKSGCFCRSGYKYADINGFSCIHASQCNNGNNNNGNNNGNNGNSGNNNNNGNNGNNGNNANG